uniref:Serine protease n=1 Tax=Thermocrispum agreste TaxID=37925 RepID=A0A2W4JKT6_9PSEU|nr:MAG: serine protease [Thermocrispum agreste]
MNKRKLIVAAVAAALAGGTAAVAVPAMAAPAVSGKTVEFNVLAERGADLDEVAEAVEAAGGTVVKANKAVGLLTVRAPEKGFTAAVTKDDAVYGATEARAIGVAPKLQKKAKQLKSIETEHRNSKAKQRKGTNRAAKQGSKRSTMDPLDDQLWGLKMVRADLARDVTSGDKRVLVGVIDTGVDGSHPDIAPNFDKDLSRNFTVDMPTDPNGVPVDGPCEFRGCVDPADHDDNGHGTHVAGIIAAAANDLGISGVAPDVTLVNLRAGMDAGYFFVQPVVDALTYAGDHGIDVVNMSFYVDPWLYNCDAHPEDSPEEQAAQRTIKEAVTRALEYAHSKGVTLVSALGNQHEDSGNPLPDTSSPNFPSGVAKTREIDNDTCLSMPTEGPNVINVSALGPSKKKADYSSYGLERISVSAPGGYYRDYYGTPDFAQNDNLILSAYPKNVALAEGAIDEDGNITELGEAWGVQRVETEDGEYAYYQPLQGTSMASPHAAGVAALIVSQYGSGEGADFGLEPEKVRAVLEGTAIATPCPVPRTVDYINEGRDETWTATCEGGWEFNGFYGHGVVDAYGAVRHGASYLNN